MNSISILKDLNSNFYTVEFTSTLVANDFKFKLFSHESFFYNKPQYKYIYI